MLHHHDDINDVGNALLLTEEEFKFLFQSKFIGLCSFVQFKYGLDTDIAKEVVHTAFIKLWQSRARLLSLPGIMPYLYKIIHNKSLDVLKHQKLHRMYSLLAVEDEIHENWQFPDAELKELSEAIKASVATLPKQMRRIFEMSRFEGAKYAEIADKMNLSVKTVETQMTRALQKLRILLSEYLSVVIVQLAIQALLY